MSYKIIGDAFVDLERLKDQLDCLYRVIDWLDYEIRFAIAKPEDIELFKRDLKLLTDLYNGIKATLDKVE